jgi:two-component system response regulator (stage 0 sporulation protein A)
MGRYTLLVVDNNCEQTAAPFKTSNRFNMLPPIRGGREAIEVISSEHVDVVLLEIVLADYDGLWVLEKLRDLDIKDKPIVIVYSLISVDPVIKNVVELGAKYFIMKPQEYDILEQRILEFTEKNMATQREASMAPQRSSEQLATEMIRELGIPAHLNGYQYLRAAILLAAQNASLLNGITTRIYPKVSVQFSTTPARVERAIRHAIEVAWNRGNIDTLQHFFGYTIQDAKGKPTNGEFIAMLADRIRINT